MLSALRLVTTEENVNTKLDKLNEELGNMKVDLRRHIDQHQMVDQNPLIKATTPSGDLRIQIKDLDSKLVANMDSITKASNSLKEMYSQCDGILKAQAILAKNITDALDKREGMSYLDKSARVKTLVTDRNNLVLKTNTLQKYAKPVLSDIQAQIIAANKLLAQFKQANDEFGLMPKTPAGNDLHTSYEKLYKLFAQKTAEMNKKYGELAANYKLIAFSYQNAKSLTASRSKETENMISILTLRPASPTASPRPSDSDYSSSESGSDSDSDSENTITAKKPLHKQFKSLAFEDDELFSTPVRLQNR